MRTVTPRYYGERSDNGAHYQSADAAVYDSVNHNCKCGNQDNTASQEIIAMVYSPWQNYVKVYEPSKALSRGTIFEELDKPFGPCLR